MTTHTRPSRKPYLVTAIFALVILVPAMYGFGKKFYEFIALYESGEGSFALVPILNYLLASAGFFFVLCWAALRGMFRDIEKPKFNMLDSEKQLDLYESSHSQQDTRSNPPAPLEKETSGGIHATR